MNPERLLRVIKKPHVSEKSVTVGDKYNQVVFSVVPDASKKEIKTAVEKLFNVKVENVHTVNVKGKRKLFRQQLGQRKNWKKAYVQLAEGHDLDFTKVAEL